MARGLKPKKYSNGAPFNGKCGNYVMASGDSTAAFIGDLLVLTGEVDSDTGLAVVAQSGATVTTAKHAGVLMGVDPMRMDSSSQNFSRKHRPASVRNIVQVADDPMLIFEIEEDAVGGAVSSPIGKNAQLVVGSGSTTTGYSANLLDSSTAANNDPALPLKIVGKNPVSGEFEVILNLHYKALQADIA